MEERNLNCWEFKGCGRESGGKNVSLYGVCPAAIDERADGIHNGKNGGRCCWVVASTYSAEGTFGCYSSGFNKCCECDFYKMVKEDTELLVMV
ncbi:MAG: hypothetical protein D3903_09270 [Candidatus Electrothrix sp. GM3_4]|nr:hypothetical protein [Candidatus Electrothrix sp. GM3_4]